MAAPSLANYRTQWAVSFAAGCLSWLLAVSFAGLLPAPLQLLAMLWPLLCFVYAYTMLPRWQKQGRERDMVESLVERVRSHKLMRQYQFDIAAVDREYEAATVELDDLFGESVRASVAEPMELPGTSPLTQLSLPQKANYLLQVQHLVTEVCGTIGWELVEYVSGKGESLCDGDGWILLERVRSAWGRNRGLNTEQLRGLINLLVNMDLAQWYGHHMKSFRLVAIGESVNR